MGIVCGEVVPELFQSVFSAETIRLTENLMEGSDFIAIKSWDGVVAVLRQPCFSQFSVCKGVKVTEAAYG